MSDKNYIFSTLTSSVEYRNYATGGADLPNVDKSVLIVGGSNVPDKHLITPYGIMTEISAEDYSWLQDNELFKLHKANGFVTVRDKPADAEKVAASDLNTRDQSAPLVEQDFEEDKKPTSAKDDDKPKPTSSGNSRRA